MDAGQHEAARAGAPRPLDVSDVEEAVRSMAALVMSADALERRYRATSGATAGADQRRAALRWAVQAGRGEIARLVADQHDRQDECRRPEGGPAV